MKRLLHFFTLLALQICIMQWAHPQSVDSALNFYPMHKGDYWLYDWHRYQAARYYVFVEITGDTVMPNSLRYFVFSQAKLSEPAVPCSYKRLDSATACVFQWIPEFGTEYMVDSLRALKGDSFQNFYVIEKYCSLYAPDTVLSVPTLVKGFHGIQYDSPQDQFAYGFGLCHTYCDDTLDGTHQSLVYARINGVQFGTPVAVAPTPPLPQKFQLLQNYPNPFNPSTTIAFSIPRESDASLQVIDLLGRVLTDMFIGRKPAGLHTVQWTSDLSSGVYFYRIQATSVSRPHEILVQTRRMVQLK